MAEEAALTAEFLGNEVRRFYDVGVAGRSQLVSRKAMINVGVSSNKRLEGNAHGTNAFAAVTPPRAEGLLRHVPRNKSGIRDYDEASCNAVEFVKCMRDAGMSIESLVEYMELLERAAAHLTFAQPACPLDHMEYAISQ